MRKSAMLSPVLALSASLILMSCSGEGIENAAENGEQAISALSSSTGPKSYIVRLKEGVDVDATLEDLNLKHGVGIIHRYHHAIQGGSMLIATEAAREELAKDARVEAVDADQLVFATGRTTYPRSTDPKHAEPLLDIRAL